MSKLGNVKLRKNSGAVVGAREGSDVSDTIGDTCYYLGGRIRYV